MFRPFFLSLVAFTLWGCGSLQRSPESGYVLRDSQTSSYGGRTIRSESLETQKVAAEMGFAPDEILSPEQWRQIEERRRLRALESKMSSAREKEQYSKIVPWLANDAEKIELLSIPTLEGRQAWINSRNIWKRAQNPPPAVRNLIDSGDIAVGMQMEYVRKAWGEPQAIDVSGNPAFKNERWRYVRFISTPDGYRQERRYVYFEGGRVVGWETE